MFRRVSCSIVFEVREFKAWGHRCRSNVLTERGLSLFQQIFNCHISWVIVALEPFYLLLQIHNLLVDGIVLDFCKPLTKVKGFILWMMCASSTTLINPIPHVLTMEATIKIVSYVMMLAIFVVG